MASLIIPTMVVLGFIALGLRQLRARRRTWMPAEARAQFQRETRHPVRIPFVTSVAIRSYGDAEVIAAESQDLAIGGMLLKPCVPLSIGQPIQVSFSLPTGPLIEIPAVVCRTVGQSFGIQFDFMDKQRALISDWVDQECGATLATKR